MIEKSTDKILCVDDEENILFMFRRSLGREYDLFTAGSSDEAVKMMREHGEFAVIISDYTMPKTNGVEFLKIARAISPNSVQILLTGNIELDIAIKAINETNVFRYLPKPFPIDQLRKVLSAALNQYQLIIGKQQVDLALEHKNNELAVSNAELEKQKKLLEYELEMAKNIFGKVIADRYSAPEGLEYLLQNQDTAGGDFLLTHINQQEQSLYLIMGDLTGHGLSSALAVLLVTEIFDALCSNGNPDVEQLARGINDKMRRKLPVGLFCAGFLIKLDWRNEELHIWQGGMPEAYLLDEHGQVLKTLVSNNLPLGAAANQDFTGTASRHDASEAASLFAYSDGVVEQSNNEGEMFGYDRLRHALCKAADGMRRVDAVFNDLRAFQRQHPQFDDISMFELHFSRARNALISSALQEQILC